ncbi:MAG: DUF4097 family beta strand repeat-containing protein, partial [Acidobacteriota bacterium]
VGLHIEATQDFEKIYPVTPAKHIIINNILGDISVSGYKGDQIKVIARKKGPDSEAIKIIDKSFGPRVELFPVVSNFKNNKTRVDFELKIPESGEGISLELKSGSGKIEVADINGNLVVNSFRGNVKVENIKGNILAHSVSGDIDASIKKNGSERWMKFDSMSGNIKVTAPKDIDARIQMSTSGTLKSDFSIQSRKNRYGGQFVRGKLGSGKQRIDISSVFGSVSLLKR